MKHKVSELSGALLDAAVAKAAGFPLDEDGDRLDERTSGGAPMPFHPSADWRDAGPIIERERIMVGPETEFADGSWEWEACTWSGKVCHGPNPLIAAMRAYIASRFGEEIELT